MIALIVIALLALLLVVGALALAALHHEEPEDLHLAEAERQLEETYGNVYVLPQRKDDAA